MSSSSEPRRRPPRISPEQRGSDEEVVKPLELFFDLVFVLGFTRCTALMVADPTWGGLARGMLVLAVLWWAWTAYAWLTSVINPEEGAVRLIMFAAMAGLLVVSLAVPQAFDDRALIFAIAYAVVRAGQLGLYWIASRDDAAMRSSVAGLAVSSAIGVGLLTVASFLDGTAQGAVWVLAILLDFGGPALFGIAGWQLVPSHFAERHGLVMILALGESIVALGVGAELKHLDVSVITAAVLGVGLASALWWLYFDVVSLVTERRLSAAEPGRERNSLARDSYSYLHLPMVAGIILGALGLEATLHHVHEPLSSQHAFALLGGTAIYLLAHVALRLRNARTINVQRLGLALLLLALIPIATEVSPLVTLAGINVSLWTVIAYETARYDERRYQLRHGLD